MHLPAAFREKLELCLLQKSGRDYKILETKQVSGGSINNCYSLVTDKGYFFVKVNNEKDSLKNFEAESAGLSLLKKYSSFELPEVIAIGTHEKDSFLLLTHLTGTKETLDYWHQAGTHLAHLHRNTNKEFGLDHDNFIGKLPQLNTKTTDFDEFFFHCRLEPQLKLARDKGLLDKFISPSVTRLHKSFMEIVPKEPPTLIHGDLWSGNIMPVQQGAAIYDPAVSYAHREMDIAMTKLFGGFSEEFYNEYNRHYPLVKDWQKRVDIFNLYPLLVHVNLFGGSYVSQVLNILKRF
jgi:fructosamine-3-kinase